VTVFILRRLWQSVFVLLAVSIIVFVGVYAIGDPIDMLVSPEADQIERDRATKALGLDQPLYKQYFIFLKNALRGDLGSSFVYNEPAMKVILQRMPATLELAALAMFFSVICGIPLGMLSGLKSDHFVGRMIMSASILGFSLPTFWVGLMLIMFFSVFLPWFPSGGRGETVEFLGMQLSFFTVSGLMHLVMPALNLALFKFSLTIRLARSGVKECMVKDYVKFAKAKGLSKSRIVGVHILKNILIPVVTVLGLELGGIIAFAVVTETIFSWPGMGKLIIDSISLLDRPVIVAYLLVISFMFVTINFIVDVLYSVIDPRVRLQDLTS